jgi:hypothetical protein
MDFTGIVSGVGNSRLEKKDGEDRGLTHVYLADFAWSDWEALLGGANIAASRTPESTANTSSPTNSFYSVSLPYLRVHLGYISPWKMAGFKNEKHEDRQESVIKAVIDDPARTVNQIYLDTGFTDLLAITHSAWLLLQREHGGSRESNAGSAIGVIV